jgi:ankyrin repeat protein
MKAAQPAPPSRCCSSPQDGWTPLSIAAEHGHLDVVKALLAAGCNKEAANQASHATRHNSIGVHEAVCVRVCLC